MTAGTQHPESRDGAIARFWQRWHTDGADGMSEEQWGAWVDALPRDEFLAMLHIGIEQQAEDERETLRRAAP